jgi:hypothetical protein
MIVNNIKKNNHSSKCEKKLFTKARPFDKQPSNAHGNLEEHGACSLCSIP